MARTISIGAQGFEDIRRNGYFYIDKTDFIREWWENGDSVTLITRPRRFGKTLNLDMLNCFFSMAYQGRGEELFKGLKIWEEMPFCSKFRAMQGTYPVIFLSFARIKEQTAEGAIRAVCRLLSQFCGQFDYLFLSDKLQDYQKEHLERLARGISEEEAPDVLNFLSEMLYRYSGRKPLILLDEYDTPLQEAYLNGYWKEMSDFIRSLFNSTFKSNPYMERGLLTGITRVSKESIFSELNNLTVVSTTSPVYETSFGFTQEEVTESLEEYGLSDQSELVRKWYDGFTFGASSDIYNPWSITNYLKYKTFRPYWAGTSSNRLVGDLIRKGSDSVKQAMMGLLDGKEYVTELDEQIVFSQLDQNESAVWSLLLASGYLRVKSVDVNPRTFQETYHLVLTDFEVELMFENMIREWFSGSGSGYNEFMKALLRDDVESMNVYMNRVAEDTFSSFDSGTKPSGNPENQPERFWHGFVLGLLVGLRDEEYEVKSNRESGFGRYDVMVIPMNVSDDRKHACILEFKVQGKDEETLEETVQAALGQIRHKDYKRELLTRGFPEKRIYSYGFAFCGKKVLIGKQR